MTRPWLLISPFHLNKCVNRSNAILFSHFGSTEGDQTTSVRSFWKKEDCWGKGHWRGKVQEFRILPPGKTKVCTLISTFLRIPCHDLYLHIFSPFIFLARDHLSLVWWIGRNVQNLQKNTQLCLERCGWNTLPLLPTFVIYNCNVFFRAKFTFFCGTERLKVAVTCANCLQLQVKDLLLQLDSRRGQCNELCF